MKNNFQIKIKFSLIVLLNNCVNNTHKNQFDCFVFSTLNIY